MTTSYASLFVALLMRKDIYVTNSFRKLFACFCYADGTVELFLFKQSNN